MSSKVFAYGTLMFPEVASRVAGIDGWGEPVLLTGYSRFKVVKRERTRGLYPAIVPNEEGSVNGLLFRGITSLQLKLLDEFEEVREGSYTRECVSVDADGENCDAQIYVACEPLRKLMDGSLWSPHEFRMQELDWYLSNVVDDFVKDMRRKYPDESV